MDELKDSMVHGFLEDVKRFQLEVLGLDVPAQPTELKRDRFTFAKTALQEELNEFIDAYESNAGLPEQADALIDLVYFALGRLLEMGIPPGPAFAEVQAANMRKKRGRTKRGHALDAAKPENWKGPDYEWLISLTRQECDVLRERPECDFPILCWKTYVTPVDPIPVDMNQPRAMKKEALMKPQVALIPYEALAVEAEAFGYGAYVKYRKWDWTRGRFFSELMSSTYHHLAAWFDREIYDQDSKIHHLGHARADIAMMIALEKMERTDLDDRRPPDTVTYHTPGDAQ